MTDKELFGHVRERIGNPDRGDVSNDRLRDYVQRALVQMADELQFRTVTDDQALALVADQMDYPLPSDVLSILWVSWSDRRLEPFGLGEFDRDLHEYRTQESSEPVQFAVRGRRLYVYPAPSEDSVSTDGYLSVSYVGTPAEMGAQGPVGLSDSDEWLLIDLAALDWCLTNPSEANAARVVGCRERLYGMDGDGGAMKRAKQRWLSQGTGTAKHFHSTLKPFTGGRTGGAR